MNKRIIYIVTFFVTLLSCHKKNSTDLSVRARPVIIDAKEYIVSSTGFERPLVKKVQASKGHVLNKSIVSNTNTNIHFIGKPEIRKAGIPLIIISGGEKYQKPELLPLNSIPFLAGIPETVLVKDASIKDQNPGNFSIYSKQQGMKHDVIRCMLQDKTGNIWFGTNGGGITKYDGKYFTHYSSKEGLSNNFVLSALEDKNGNIWFGTNGGGVSKFDGKYFTNYAENEGLSNNNISCILQDGTGNMWFGSLGGGVSRFDGKTITHFTQKQGLGSNYISAILEDKKGDFWIGTLGGGVSKLTISGKKDQEHFVFTQFTEKEGLGNNFISDVFQDSIGRLWFTSKEKGISIFDGQTFTNYSKEKGLTNDLITCIIQDKKHEIWLGTNGNGIIRLNDKTELNFNIFDGLSNNRVFCALEDNKGNLWFGTDGGINKFNGNIFTHYTEKEGLLSSTVYSILQDKKRNLWIGTEGGGVSKYTKSRSPDKHNSFTNYTRVSGLCDNSVYTILQDSDNYLWFGSYNGCLSKFNGKFITDYFIGENAAKNDINCLIEDTRGNIWFGTENDGVSKFDGKLITRYTVKQGLSSNRVYSLMQDNFGNIWIGTSGGGICKIDYNGLEDWSQYKITCFTGGEGFNSSIINCIYQDKQNNIWFGTNGGGVVKYDGNRIEALIKGEKNAKEYIRDLKKVNGKYIKTYTCFTEAEDLINNTVLSILEDKKGNLWFGTRFGLSRMSLKNLLDCYPDSENFYNKNGGNGNSQIAIFKNFSYEDGFLGIGCNRGAFYEDLDGNIWIGANDKLTVYHPDGDETDTIPPEINLIDIELFHEKIQWSNLNPKNDTSFILKNGTKIQNFSFETTTKWYGLPVKLSLAYNNNYLNFRYIGITQKQSQKVKYRYKLEGFDENWSGLTTRNEVSYENLPDGEFIFKVKAMSSNGFWSKEYNYPFKIFPPWWKTKIFRLFMILILTGFIFGIYRWRISTLRRQKKQLEKMVTEKTSEILLQKEELETSLNNLQMAQKQIIHSEKMASLGTLAAGVAHEINNPLNFIQGGVFILERYFKDNLKDHIEQVAPILDGINVGVNRTTAIVSSLNHYSRQDDELREACNIHTIIDNCLVMLQNETKNRIEIEKNYTPLTYSLSANEGKMHQAMLNILSNACHAIETKGKIVIVTNLKAEILTISITDNGAGMSKEVLSKVFDPFFTTKDPGKGTGLGLSITYNIIKEHGGEIEIKSTPGIGTNVLILFTIDRHQGPHYK